MNNNLKRVLIISYMKKYKIDAVTAAKMADARINQLNRGTKNDPTKN